MAARDRLPEVRNPVLALPASVRLMALPTDSRAALSAVLLDLRDDARIRAEQCWRKHKAPMAVYWKCVGVYSNHLARALARREV